MVWLDNILQDLRYGYRAMRRSPLVTAVAVLSLALGIGANTAIFTVFYAFLLKTLPVKDPQDVVMLSWVSKESPNRAEPDHSFSFPAFERLRRSSFGVAGFSFIDGFSIVAQGRADIALGEAVSGNYYSVLGVSPVIGRAFTDDDDRDSAAPVSVISYHAWETRFGRDPRVIGQVISLAGVPVTLVGVEPKEFLGLTTGYAADFKIPLGILPQIARQSNVRSAFLDQKNESVKIAARVPRGNEAQAHAEINVLLQQSLAPDQPGRVVIFGRGGEGWDIISRQFRSPLLVLMAAVGLILLIACANVANLLLARCQTREKETAMRLALGAGAGRLIRQFLTESLLLAAAGGALGIVLAYHTGDLLVHGFTDLTFDVHPDLKVLTFTAAVTLGTGILFGLAPAIRAAQVDLQPGLQRDARPSKFRLANLLIVAQLALSVVAVVGAGLYVRTLHNLRSTGLGMNTRNLMVFRLIPAASGYKEANAAEFAQRVLERIEKLPGVESAALSRVFPLRGSGWLVDIELPGSAPFGDSGSRRVTRNWVTPRYFETMGIPLLLGRGIEQRDRAGAPRIAVINESFAHDYFARETPLGRHFRAEKQDYEIVGVVRGSKYEIRSAAAPAYFASYLQSPDNYNSFTVELKTAQNPMAIAGDVRRVVGEIDPNIPLLDLATAEETIDKVIRQDRLFAGLSSIFGALALLLAAIGLYGVRAYAVVRRTPEIGIRMALGADRSAITQMILRETAWLAFFGVAIGTGVAWSVTRYIQSMLYGLASRDFPTFAGAALVLIGVAALAGYLPARRASNVDPMTALRHE